ncbi:MAG: tRNA glutamyl-Q(34) synthetase GluQRS [Methylotenera sp.]|jgi:glutamyl-Q tRNA(Asp) synthetase|uniref:tRNA glutamyl-Q(34) synthetase GluQRS n=1 Tax=Methylotenera sp. TaxID=2051956 RepID=UPI00272585E1|nr:tRNA glutamyl-Q(34) synthetase GluQRS [Methylotenera sp.]MDO9151762.1 tRNA glutamyl-Q(34) synthetase GluQRS [Methylotenera sp.]
MYVGRFAPSPTGPLHFGSLVAAVASYCEAKANQGLWLVRMEDLDRPREMKGAADAILHQLEAFGFEWDSEVIYQSKRNEFYSEILQQLKQQQLIYPCTCTRKEIADSSNQIGIDSIIYPKTCLTHPPKTNAPIAWRIKTSPTLIKFNDAIQGSLEQNIADQVGDFVLKRADGLYAYQLAVVADDAEQKITHVVRGADLLDSTSRQIYLQQQLNYNALQYAHVPVASNIAGDKLSKQTLAKAIEVHTANHLLYDALSFLGQHPPAEIKNATLKEIWHWCGSNWQLTNIPKTRKISVPS